MPETPAKLQPAFYAGLVIGVLSGLPVVNLGNCVCCMWVVGGGALAVYLMQQNYPNAITAADGALVGLLAGAIGGVVSALISIPLTMAMGPMQQHLLDRVASNPDFPEQYRGILETMGRNAGGMSAFRLVAAVIGVCINAIFGMLGGLLGVAMFKKSAPPPPPGSVEVLPPV